MKSEAPGFPLKSLKEENNANLEQVVTSDLEKFEDFLLVNRLGSLAADTSPQKLLHVLRAKLGDLSNKIYDTFYVQNNIEIVLLQAGDSHEILMELSKEITAVYFTAKLASLKCAELQIKIFQETFSLLQSLFESLLKLYSSKGEDAVNQDEFTVILSLGFLCTALSQFIGPEASDRVEKALTLLISLAPIQQIVDSFKNIIPPAHKSRLFTLTLYNDLQKMETRIDTSEPQQIAKLKGIMEVVLNRYGDFFLSYYADEVLLTFNEKDLVDCPVALWEKATHGTGSRIQTELGPSFIVNMIKMQWGIIKDFNGIVPDPSESCLLFHTEQKNLFRFLLDQGQQLFLLVGALYTVLNEDQSYQSTFVTDAEILNKVFIELMDHLARLVMALDDDYEVTTQNELSTIEDPDKRKFIQSTKFYILLLCLSLCLIQLSLTGPLNISTTASLSAVLEHYMSRSDFTAAARDQNLKSDFQAEFKKHSVILCSNYSMIKRLSSGVLMKLEGRSLKLNVFNTGMTWNMLSFTVLVASASTIVFIWFFKTLITFLEDILVF